MPATGRYVFLPRIRGGKQTATSYASTKIQAGIHNGTIDYSVHVIEGQQRLDTLAANAYGDSSLWWVLAAASGIGWGLQVPPGTIIKVPNNLGVIYALLS
jgi:hypothetical protein